MIMENSKVILPTKKILITGGTGSFGKAFLKELLINHNYLKRIVIYSRDELKQWELQQQYPEKSFPQLRFILGSFRDKVKQKKNRKMQLILIP